MDFFHNFLSKRKGEFLFVSSVQISSVSFLDFSFPDNGLLLRGGGNV